MEIINATDGYKLGHHRMYPEGTQMVYSNWTPRSCRYFPEATEGSVVFGIQYFVKKYLIEEFNKWFALPKEEAIKQFAYRVGNFVDLNQVGTKHIEELYDLGYQVVLPDAGAKKRYMHIFEESTITCSKVRDQSTGKILEIKIDNPEKLDGRPLMIVDDLCDGGGTFCGIAECFKKIGIPRDKLNITVTHMVNPRGIENLSKNFNHVWFTNSYKDWENLPENVTMDKIV